MDTADQRKLQRDAYVWNTVGGLIFGCQSVFMLIALTRVCDIYTAGVFTIAFANANLFLTVGKFGMRKFQASDRRGQFAFREYHASRITTCIAMIVTSFAFIAYSSLTLGYSPDKTLVMVMMCLFKVIEAIEDVYTGAYQLENRLDVGAKMFTLRMVATLIAFSAIIAITADLLLTLAATTVFSALFFVGQVRYVRNKYRLPTLGINRGARFVLELLRECLPVFAADFLLFYMGNAPKYAIDMLLDDSAQAYYGYIAMPVFVVSMLASFIYNPMITSITDQWDGGDVRGFLKRIGKVTAMIILTTAACVIAAWLVGVPILDLLYNTQVERYRVELVILVAGGGFLAVATFATLGITIIRFQHVLAPLYAALSLASWLVSNWAVANWAITGASWAYFAIMALSCAVFAIALAIGVRRRARPTDTPTPPTN